MSKRAELKKPVSLNDICAVTCNFARPKSASACVKRLRDLKLQEIIVWNNGVAPIPEATKNINIRDNIGSIGRYYAAMQTSKPYVLIIDDDHLLTEAGLDALRKWAPHYPAVVQNGDVFTLPITPERKRIRYFSHQIKKPVQVDVVLPNKGMMLKTDLYRLIPNHWAWGSLKDVKKGFFATDYPVSCAIRALTHQYPAVAPVKGRGFQKPPTEMPGKALRHQKGIREEKTKIWKWLVKNGWQLMNAKSF